jgi:hypothetical protein
VVLRSIQRDQHPPVQTSERRQGPAASIALKNSPSNAAGAPPSSILRI